MTKIKRKLTKPERDLLYEGVERHQWYITVDGEPTTREAVTNLATYMPIIAAFYGDIGWDKDDDRTAYTLTVPDEDLVLLANVIAKKSQEYLDDDPKLDEDRQRLYLMAELGADDATIPVKRAAFTLDDAAAEYLMDRLSSDMDGGNVTTFDYGPVMEVSRLLERGDRTVTIDADCLPMLVDYITKGLACLAEYDGDMVWEILNGHRTSQTIDEWHLGAEDEALRGIGETAFHRAHLARCLVAGRGAQIAAGTVPLGETYPEINAEQRSVLYDATMMALAIATDLEGKHDDPAAVARAEEAIQKYRQLLAHIGWKEDDPRDTFTLSIPAADLAAVASGLGQQAKRAMADDGDDPRPEDLAMLDLMATLGGQC